MIRLFRPFGFVALIILTGALLLSGCGRKGPLDLPPAASVQPSEEGQPGSGQTAARRAQPIQYGSDGRPLAPPGPKRQLPIDWLID